MEQHSGHALVHRDDEASKIGMWLFIFTELLLFGGLFVVYAVYRHLNPVAFHLAAEELDVTVGTINTVILLVSSMTIAMATSSIKLGNKRLTLLLLSITMILAIIFMVNKYFEWGGKISHGIYPNSQTLLDLSQGDVLFFGLYYAMTGLHALHIIVGLVIIAVMFFKVWNGSINNDYNVQLENSGLYWHLVDLIWIFLFPLFYLIT
ncbi:MAG: cytochrome c oxidase subunit 3 family protein [Bacteroidetes bacterium]|jgi:cytochrome c oxidase subunit 3|nr:cytochrome c oxidase subunit 3 family protein [Bacteroidota bacterium]